MNRFCSLLIAFFLVPGCTPKLTPERKASLQKNLEAMVKTDQVAASRWEPKWASFKDSVFTLNKRKAEKMFSQYGFPGFAQIGEQGSRNFWLIVQHCDKFPEFQKKVLLAMDKEVKGNNADPNNYAYLFDRVQVNAGQKQKFGTQVDYDVEKTGRAFPKFGLIDSAQIDVFRAEYKLSPLKEYMNNMSEMHFEMNRARYEKMGVTEPYKYK